MGISAIEELAREIQTIHALTDLEPGTNLNVGLVAEAKASTPSYLRRGSDLPALCEPAGSRRRDGKRYRDHQP
jgi:hypothetical protein